MKREHQLPCTLTLCIASRARGARWGDGIESALERARHAAGERDVALAGGARAAQQYLTAGLVDEMQLHLVPTLLGAGERLFDNVDDLHGLTLVETVATPNVVHVKFARPVS